MRLCLLTLNSLHLFHLLTTYLVYHLLHSDTYVQGALGTINNNIFQQHSDMRKHLQDRHQDMTNDIVSFLEESTNTVAGYFTLQSDWLHENLCVIYKEVANTNTCDEPEDTLLGVVGLSLWDKLLRIEEQGDSIQKAMDIQRSLPFGVTGSDQSPVGTEVTELELIREKMDAVEETLKAVASQTEAKMDAKLEAVQGVEGKVEALEGKLDAVEGKVDAVEGKLDAIEGMLSKLMDAVTKE